MPTEQETRALIAATALRYVGSQNWIDSAARGNYPADTNKCNLFAYEALTEAGASPGLPHGHWYWRSYPPNAGDWADPKVDIPHWHVLGPGDKPQAGDVVAQSIDYTDATGHVMIVGQDNFVIGTGDAGPGPHGTIERIPLPLKMGPRPKGPEVFRRWYNAR